MIVLRNAVKHEIRGKGIVLDIDLREQDVKVFNVGDVVSHDAVLYEILSLEGTRGTHGPMPRWGLVVKPHTPEEHVTSYIASYTGVCPVCDYTEKGHHDEEWGISFRVGPLNHHLSDIVNICPHCWFQELARGIPRLNVKLNKK